MSWSDELDAALTALAKRNNPNCKFWYQEFLHADYYVDEIDCEICEYKVSYYEGHHQSYQDLLNGIELHGLVHLKEHNLLPFI